jgi:glycosyl transferase family 25
MISGFVINLDQAPEKWTHFQHDWKHIQSVTLERISGIPGKQYRASNCSVSTQCQKYCTDPMIGCYASHLDVMQRMVDRNLPMAIILEDDVYPCAQFDDKLKEFTEHYLPASYDIVLLGNRGHEDFLHNIAFSSLFKVHPDRKYTKINKYLCTPHNSHGLYGYILSLEGARKILKTHNQIRYHIGIYLLSQPDLQIYSVEPHFVFKRDDRGKCTSFKHFLELPLFQLHGCVVRLRHVIFLCIFLGLISWISSLWFQSPVGGLLVGIVFQLFFIFYQRFF